MLHYLCEGGYKYALATLLMQQFSKQLHHYRKQTIACVGGFIVKRNSLESKYQELHVHINHVGVVAHVRQCLHGAG